MVVQLIPLTCHPTTPCEAVASIDAQLLRTGDAALEMRYAVQGDISRLLIPAESPSRQADKLWQHTCFEAFIAVGAGYYEFNFSPSTQWAIYRFSAYREGMTTVAAERPPRVSLCCGADRLTLEAIVDLAPLPALRDNTDLRLALSAVIEDAQHRMSYWALAHPQGKPDFHHAGGFALKLPAGTGVPPTPRSSLGQALALPRGGGGKKRVRNRR